MIYLQQLLTVTTKYSPAGPLKKYFRPYSPINVSYTARLHWNDVPIVRTFSADKCFCAPPGSV